MTDNVISWTKPKHNIPAGWRKHVEALDPVDWCFECRI